MNSEVLIGIDGGGTHTRVVVANVHGKILSYAVGGGVHPEKNKTPKENVQQTIKKALHEARIPLLSVRKIVAGFAGLNEEADRVWANDYMEMAGLRAEKIVLNDAVIAQYGAFLGEPGVIAVSGTGSNVVGKIESGAVFSNRDFHHFPHASARYLAYAVIYEIISQKESSENAQLIEKVLTYWKVNNIVELRRLAASGFSGYDLQAVKELSNMAVIVTEEAVKGNQTAIRACKTVARSLHVGIQLVASMFEGEKIPVALIGSVANASPVKELIMKEMDKHHSVKELVLTEAVLPPVLGALLYSFKEYNITPSHHLLEKWKKDMIEKNR